MPLLDLILDYDCNLACDYCTISPAMRKRSLGTGAVLREMEQGRPDGFDGVSFTGGEPTLRADLLGLVKKAKELGYTRIKLQTNGLLLAQPSNLERLLTAGVNQLNISMHAHTAQVYDALVRREGAFEMMKQAVQIAAERVPTFEVDLILKQDTLQQVPEAVRWASVLGVNTLNLWLVSLTDHNRENLRSAVSFTQASPVLKSAFSVGDALGVRVRSLHVPACMLPVGYKSRLHSPLSEDVRVVTPDATFDLSQSKLTG